MSVHQVIDRRDVLTSAEVVALIPELASTGPSKPIMSEAAAPDVPAAVGAMIVSVYALMMLGFFVGFARGADATMMVIISALYTAIYLAVPAVLLKVEGASGQIGFQRFMRVGLQTWTGHLSGGEALVQMLLIPGAISIAILSIGIVVALSA